MTAGGLLFKLRVFAESRVTLMIASLACATVAGLSSPGVSMVALVWSGFFSGLFANFRGSPAFRRDNEARIARLVEQADAWKEVAGKFERALADKMSAAETWRSS